MYTVREDSCDDTGTSPFGVETGILHVEQFQKFKTKKIRKLGQARKNPDSAGLWPIKPAPFPCIEHKLFILFYYSPASCCSNLPWLCLRTLPTTPLFHRVIAKMVAKKASFMRVKTEEPYIMALKSVQVRGSVSRSSSKILLTSCLLKITHPNNPFLISAEQRAQTYLH